MCPASTRCNSIWSPVPDAATGLPFVLTADACSPRRSSSAMRPAHLWHPGRGATAVPSDQHAIAPLLQRPIRQPRPRDRPARIATTRGWIRKASVFRHNGNSTSTSPTRTAGPTSTNSTARTGERRARPSALPARLRHRAQVARWATEEIAGNTDRPGGQQGHGRSRHFTRRQDAVRLRAESPHRGWRRRGGRAGTASSAIEVRKPEDPPVLRTTTCSPTLRMPLWPAANCSHSTTTNCWCWSAMARACGDRQQAP